MKKKREMWIDKLCIASLRSLSTLTLLFTASCSLSASLDVIRRAFARQPSAETGLYMAGISNADFICSS